MKFKLKIVILLTSFVFIGIFILNKNGKPVNAKNGLKTELDTIRNSDIFISKLSEPWREHQFERDVHHDFRPENSLDFKELVLQESKNVHIVKLIGDEELDSFLIRVDSLINLEALDIVNANIDSEKFKELIEGLKSKTHFKKLFLFHCGVKSVPNNINQLKNLVSLDLSLNKIRVLPNEICELKNLRYLRVYNNRKLKELPITLGELQKLEKLDFAGTGIIHLPNSIGDCTNLIHITGNACNLKEIPEEIVKCKRLKYINLSYNKIERVPIDIGELEKLNNLSIGGNLINELPDSFGKLKQLGFCDLSRNKFTEFPTQVLTLPNVYNLWMHENAFKRVSVELGSLKKLTHFLVDEPEILKSDIEELKRRNPLLRIIDED